MQPIADCYRKVSKDCIKFIRSQETPKEKFKNKEKMIKSFLIPLCFWISKKANKKKPYFVGLAGGQGTGKTTISSLIKIILIKYFKLNDFRISIDDFYKTRKERIHLSKKIQVREGPYTIIMKIGLMNVMEYITHVHLLLLNICAKLMILVCGKMK